MIPQREEIEIEVGGTELGCTVTRRYQVLSLEDLADQVAAKIPPEGLHFDGEEGREKLRNFARSVGAWILHDLRSSMTKAAEKAFGDLAALIEDPKYHTTVKERRRRDREREQAWRREQEDKAVRESARMLTEEEIAKKKDSLESQRSYYVHRIRQIDDELIKLGSEESWPSEKRM